MADRAVRIGIIGCGQIAQHHMRTYVKIPGATMVACCDIIPERTAKASDEYKIPDPYDNFRELLKRDDIEAVDVCLHNNYHMPVTVAALEAGKHVYCEKPMAGAYADAARMLQAARKTGKKLHIQLSTLYANETRAARELIAAGELGDVYHARSTGHRRRGRPFVDGYGSETFVKKAVAAGGALYDMGVYHIAQILYLLANPNVNRISGKTYQKMAMDDTRKASSGYSVEELGMGFVRFEGDLTMDIIEAWAINLDRFDGSCIVGSKGGLRLDPFGFFRSFGDVDVDGAADTKRARYRWDNVRRDGYFYGDSQQHWISALQGKCDLLPTAEIALNTMLISEGIYLSDKLGREVTADEVRKGSISIGIPLGPDGRPLK